MCQYSAANPRKNVAIEANKPHTSPNIDVASPYKFDGIVLLIIEIIFPGQTSAEKVKRYRDKRDTQKFISIK